MGSAARLSKHLAGGALNLKNFAYHYSHQHEPSRGTATVLSHPHWPLYRELKSRLESRSRNALWIYVTGSTDAVPVKVVRNWCLRRLKQAFKDALRDQGLDTEGRRLLSNGMPALQAEITGTLSVYLRKPIVTAEYAEIKEEARKVIDKLVPRSS